MLSLIRDVTCMLAVLRSRKTVFISILKNKKNMSVPQAAFAVCKIRKNEELKKQYERDDCNANLSLAKYSGKYMNSIWGMYNRYSVHNFKKNMDEHVSYLGQQKESVGPTAFSVEQTSTDAATTKSGSSSRTLSPKMMPLLSFL